MRRPAGLTFLMWLYAFWSATAVLVLVVVGVGRGEMAVDGRTVDRIEVMERTLPVLLPLALALGGGALAVSLRRSWARPALILPLALAALVPAAVAEQSGVEPAARLGRGIAGMAPVILLLAWYLYGRAGVVAYFRRLRHRA